jgi:hypothetical protein
MNELPKLSDEDAERVMNAPDGEVITVRCVGVEWVKFGEGSLFVTLEPEADEPTIVGG